MFVSSEAVQLISIYECTTLSRGFVVVQFVVQI
jgi:hypothetical protein